ncbi:MAG: alanine racemase [Christensenellales bacterium]
MQRYNVCEIDLAAIRHNVGVMKSHIAGGAKFLAVVKADAYGHGAVPVAKAALEAGADMLAVAIPEEGIELRNAGIAAPILVLGGIEESAAEAVVQYNLTQVVFDESRIRALAQAGRKLGQNSSGASQAGYGHEPYRRAHRGRSAGADAAHRQPERH